MAYTDPTRSHANNPEWMRLCREVIEEAKKVTALGGGKILFAVEKSTLCKFTGTCGLGTRFENCP